MSDIPTTTVDITKEQAAEALRAAAFRVDDLDSSEYGRTLIHCFLGSFGADWDLDDAIRTLAKADRVAWTTNLFHHDLAMESDGKVYHFEVERPEVQA